ncbi:MAG: hypothetical protein ACHREM_01350 [Polyangiales bacterium]
MRAKNIMTTDNSNIYEVIAIVRGHEIVLVREANLDAAIPVARVLAASHHRTTYVRNSQTGDVQVVNFSGA